MGQESDQIEHRIASERGQLGYNLNVLQSKVEDATDWRVQFRKRPMLMMSAALGGGLLLASILGRRSRPRYRPCYVEDRGHLEHEHRRGTEIQKQRALETFDTIKGAVIGVTADRVKDWLGEAVPGFREHFEKTAQQKRSAAVSDEPRGMSASAAG